MWSSERFLWPFFSSSCLFRLSLRGFVSPTFCGVAAESPASSGCEIPFSLPEGRVNNFGASPWQRDNSAQCSTAAISAASPLLPASLPRGLQKADLPCCNNAGRSCWRMELFSLLCGFGWILPSCPDVRAHSDSFLQTAQHECLVVDTFCRDDYSCTMGEVLAGSSSTVQNICALDGASDPVLGCSG